MRFDRRRFLAVAGAVAAAPALPSIAVALDYPTRPVRLVVGFAPGGTPDITARFVAQALSERLGQPFFVDNRPGAGTDLGTEAVVRAAPDGYTLLLVLTPNVISPAMHDNLNFDFIRDIAPVAPLDRGAFVIVVNPSFPAKTLPEFIAYAKTHPGAVTMASNGTGNLTHVFGALFMMMAGLDVLHVPFRGEGPAQAELLSGRVQVMFDPLAACIDLIKAGKLWPLAVTTATRTPALPEVPPAGDFVPGYDVSGWQGIGAPRNTPPEIIDKLNRTINEILADPKIEAHLADLGQTPLISTPAEFGRFLAEESDKWSKVIRAAGIKAQ